MVSEGGATLKALTRLLPQALAYWPGLGLRRAGYGAAAVRVAEVSVAPLATRLPPAAGVLPLPGASPVTDRTGEQHPLARKLRTKEVAPDVFGQALVLVSAQGGRGRVPVRAAGVAPQLTGQHNLRLRQLGQDFGPPAWGTAVSGAAAAAFAAKATRKRIADRGWG
jgi:hypothetical protein